MVYETPGIKKGANSAYPSIVLAGGVILLGYERGDTVVLQPGREYKEIARNRLGKYRTTPVFVGDNMYLRCFDKLYCIGKKPEAPVE